jgi:hypothetical protein
MWEEKWHKACSVAPEAHPHSYRTTTVRPGEVVTEGQWRIPNYVGHINSGCISEQSHYFTLR